jgi:drug/metabolite transporter (DMT)-like permease
LQNYLKIWNGRLEAVGWRSFYGGLKILGIVITVGGAMLLSFYRRPSTRHPNSPSPGSNNGTFFVNKLEGRTRLILGPVLMFLSAIAWSTWLVFQSKLLELYPARLRLSTLQCLIGSVQSTIIAAALERERNSWKIRWDIQLASLAYCVSLSFPHTTYCHYHLTIINIYILLLQFIFNL